MEVLGISLSAKRKHHSMQNCIEIRERKEVWFVSIIN
jgi:hypothetical protein